MESTLLERVLGETGDTLSGANLIPEPDIVDLLFIWVVRLLLPMPIFRVPSEQLERRLHTNISIINIVYHLRRSKNILSNSKIYSFRFV